jgi:hypothetical protein
MRHATTLAALAAFAMAVPPGQAAAQFRTPDCAALAGWAQGHDRNERWQPNPLAQRHAIYAQFLKPATAATFGKPVLDWTPEEARTLDRPFLACAQEVGRAQPALRRVLQELRVQAINQVPAYLTARDQARAASTQAMAALQAAPPSLPLLSFYAALPNAVASPQANAQATQQARVIQGPAQAPASALLAALRDLPADEINATIRPQATERAQAMRGAVAEALARDIGAVPANLPGLQSLDRLGQAVVVQYVHALGAEGVRTVDQAIAARKAAIDIEITAELVRRIGAVPEEVDGFGAIDQAADPRVLSVLAPASAGKVREAAAAQRKKLAEALVPALRQKLAALPASDASLLAIDADVLPGIAGLPASAAAEKPRLEAVVTERRNAILAAVNRAELGALRGRVYEGSGAALEFVDHTRVFLKMGSDTAAGTYTEERDGRVVVTINNNATVLTREGRRLLGGPVVFTRTK